MEEDHPGAEYPKQEYGKYLTGLLEKRTDAELALFSDPVEAAAFFCLLDIAQRTFGREGPAGYRDRHGRDTSGAAASGGDVPVVADGGLAGQS